MNHTKTSKHQLNRTGARVSSPSSGVRPGARALNLELPTSFVIRLFVGVLGLLFGGLLLSHSAYAASYLNVSSGGAVSLGSIRPTSSGTSSTGSDTLTVHTDCSAGYSVYVSGQNGKDTNLTNSSAESNNTISTSSNAIGSAGSLSSNTWGLNSENTGRYVGLPTYANATNKALTTKTSVAESSTVPIYYGIKVDTSITPGTYTGDVLYTVLPNSACTTYTVRFNANGGSGTMNNQTITVGKATNLTMSAFTRSGYMFLGWATSSSATAPTYKDGESVTDITGFNTTIDLYAVWGQSTGNMQDFQCTNLTPNTTTYLTDTRDNQVYSVYRWPTTGTAGTSYPANMAGACLMTKDLSLGYVTGGSVTSGSNLSLTTAASNFDSNTAETTGSSKEAVTYSSTETVNYVNSANSGTGWSTTNSYTNKQYTNGPKSGSETYSSHTYYSWGAAMVVCPKGWRLPTNTEYSNIVTFMGGNNSTGSSKIIGAPYNFIYGGGYFDSSGWNSVGDFGVYWSSTQSSSTNSQILRLASSTLFMVNFYKYTGRSVRCVAQKNYTVNYSADGAESGTPSKASEGTVYESGSVTMSTVGAMTKSGYEFKGWALTSGASEAAYQAEETVALSALLTAASSAGQTTTVGSTITLYPVWEKSGPIDEGDLGTMQDFICNNLGSGHIATLTDARDGQTYGVYRIPTDQTYAGTSTVANVAGKCIMTKDLNLGAVASVSGASSTIVANGTMTLSPNDSGFTTPGGSGESITVSTASVTVSNGTGSWGSHNSTYNTYTNKKYTTGGTGDYAGRGYYTWGAAMVACPKNWRLPTADEYYTGSAGSYEVQTGGIAAIVKGSDATTTITNITGSPYSFMLGGEYYGSFNDATSNGRYWSSTQDGSSFAYSLRVNSSSGLLRGSNVGKYYGHAVRCIADPVTATMQDFSSSSLSSTGQSTRLVDTRDGKVYTVKKLPDGKVWMMQNLTIGSTVTDNAGMALTKDDTNIDNDNTYYLPPANKQSTGTITQAPNVSGAPGDANFASNNADDTHAKTRFRTKGTYTNDSDTGYYNFYTATLGFSSYQDGKTTGTSDIDICPKNWRLPKASAPAATTSGSRDFAVLASSYNSGASWTNGTAANNSYTSDTTVKNAIYLNAASPLATTTQNNNAGFSYAGYYGGTSLLDLGAGGGYWSSSVYNTYNGRRLHFNSSRVYPQSDYSKYGGNAVRCVAKS